MIEFISSYEIKVIRTTVAHYETHASEPFPNAALSRVICFFIASSGTSDPFRFLLADPHDPVILLQPAAYTGNVPLSTMTRVIELEYLFIADQKPGLQNERTTQKVQFPSYHNVTR